MTTAMEGGERSDSAPRPLFTPEKDPVPIVQEARWTPGPDWTGTENLAPTGIRSPDRPAHSQSLYQLRYPTHAIQGDTIINVNKSLCKGPKIIFRC
jgi:hypothetical protein